MKLVEIKPSEIVLDKDLNEGFSNEVVQAVLASSKALNEGEDDSPSFDNVEDLMTWLEG
jgi:hypothetical protein